jgi:hypothetical protein
VQRVGRGRRAERRRRERLLTHDVEPDSFAIEHGAPPNTTRAPAGADPPRAAPSSHGARRPRQDRVGSRRSRPSRARPAAALPRRGPDAPESPGPPARVPRGSRRARAGLGVADHRFEDRYLDQGEALARCARPTSCSSYDSRDQVVSGVLVEALASGKPVIATRFRTRSSSLVPAPALVPHEDPEAIAAASVAVHRARAGSRLAGRRAPGRCARLGPRGSVQPHGCSRRRRSRRGATLRGPPWAATSARSTSTVRPPAPRATGSALRARSGNVTRVEKGTHRRRRARGRRSPARSQSLAGLAGSATCLRFCRGGRTPGRPVSHRRAAGGRWLDEAARRHRRPGSARTCGGSAARRGSAVRSASRRPPLPRGLSPRSNALAVLAAAEVPRRSRPSRGGHLARATPRLDRSALLHGPGRAPSAYANALLPEASSRPAPLLRRARARRGPRAARLARRGRVAWRPLQLHAVGGWAPRSRGRVRPAADQAGSMAEACLRAFLVTGESAGSARCGEQRRGFSAPTTWAQPRPGERRLPGRAGAERHEREREPSRRSR